MTSFLIHLDLALKEKRDRPSGRVARGASSRRNRLLELTRN